VPPMEFQKIMNLQKIDNFEGFWLGKTCWCLPWLKIVTVLRGMMGLEFYDRLNQGNSKNI